MIHNSLGEYDKSIIDFQGALRANPNLPYNYTNLAELQVTLNRPQEARSTLAEMQHRGLQEADQYLVQYALAMLSDHALTMQRQPALDAQDARGWSAS